jgi:Raf kinase inhibitor-like YbhB/YbcL family protein
MHHYLVASALSITVGLALTGCAGSADAPTADAPAASSLTLTSRAFDDAGTIPAQFTCDGRDISPPLQWTGVPDDVHALALIVTDLDASGFVHWVVGPIDPDRGGLDQGESTAGDLMQGVNDFGVIGWGGPCPPSGEHRYVFELVALTDPADGPLTAEDVLVAATTNRSAALTATYGQP